MIMKKILFALGMLAFALSALPQARGAEVSIDFFYDNLTGGNWIEVEGYGYGWQPDIAVSDPNWRPYTDGYWAYTDYGWTWISYEDFGWACYHYGRWAYLADYGWVWFPGSDLDWGPAWVSWRVGDDYIGWAPLPPPGPGIVYEGQPIGVRVDIEFDIGPEYYNFCDIRFIGEPVLRDRILPPVQNVTYITKTVNVTNITVQNNIVYNYGPNYDVVNAYSSRPIQRLTIERTSAANLAAAAKSGMLTKVQGNKLLVAAPPKIAKAPPTVKPPAVKAKVVQPKVEHGWKGVANKAELVQKIKTENPSNAPPPTHAAARPGGTPPAAARTPAGVAGRTPAAASPGPRGKPGRITPPSRATPRAGGSPAPQEHGKPAVGTPARPGATVPARIPPPPSERGRPTPGGRPLREHGTPPQLGPPGGHVTTPPAHGRVPERERFGTPPPSGGAGVEQPRGGERRPPAAATRQPGAPPPGALPVEGREAKERGPAAANQPGGAPKRAVPGAPERPLQQPERGKKKAEKSPPPGP
jgi:hypothetical protein